MRGGQVIVLLCLLLAQSLAAPTVVTSTSHVLYTSSPQANEADDAWILTRRWGSYKLIDSFSRAIAGGSSSTLPGVMDPSTPLIPGTIVSATCKSYAIISARGTTESQVDPNGSRGLLATVLARVPGGESYEVVYPASANFLTDPETGASDVIRHVTALLDKCPDERLVYFGYSQGAMVMINAMNGDFLKTKTLNVRGTVFYGNPYYRAAQVQDRGTATSGSGIGLLKNIVEFGNQVPPEIVPVTRDFCNQGDPVCQGLMQLKLSDVLANNGMAFAAHHYNGTLQEVEAIQFVIQQLST